MILTLLPNLIFCLIARGSHIPFGTAAECQQRTLSLSDTWPCPTFGLDSSTWSHLWFAEVRECPSWCSIVGATVTVHQFFCILHFCHTCYLCRVELVVQFPSRGSTQVLLCLFPVCRGCDTSYICLFTYSVKPPYIHFRCVVGIHGGWHFLYGVGLLPVSNLHIYKLLLCRRHSKRLRLAKQSRILLLGTWSYLWFAGVHDCPRGALLLVPQWQCIRSFVFYHFVTLVAFTVWSW